MTAQNNTPPKTVKADDGGTFNLNHLKTFTAKASKGKVAKVFPSLSLYDGFADTSKNGLYKPDRVLSAHDGVLDYDVHYDSQLDDFLVAAVGIDHDSSQTYGRWVVRYKSDVVEGYKTAFLLWPSNTPGTTDGGKWERGELDFAEGPLGGRISAFSHRTDGQPKLNAASFSFPQLSNEWHTVAVEWTPNYVQFEVDGTKAKTTNPVAIPKFDMRLVLQVETRLADRKEIINGKEVWIADPPPKTARGHVLVDFAARYSYTAPKAVK